MLTKSFRIVCFVNSLGDFVDLPKCGWGGGGGCGDVDDDDDDDDDGTGEGCLDSDDWNAEGSHSRMGSFVLSTAKGTGTKHSSALPPPGV